MMKRDFLGAIVLVASATPAYAETNLNTLIKEMAGESFVPTQEDLARQIEEELVSRLQEAPIEAVLDHLTPEAREHLNVVSLPEDDRAISVVTIWHKNSFVHVDFDDAMCDGVSCYGMEFYPLIQWKKDDGTWDSSPLFRMDTSDHLPVFEGIKANVTGINTLDIDRGLYLLSGAMPNNRLPVYAGFLVIDFQDDALILDYPAFEETSPLLDATIYDNDTSESYLEHFGFDRETKTIRFSNLGGEEGFGRDLVTVAMDASKSRSRILNERGQESLNLQFIEGRFVEVD